MEPKTDSSDLEDESSDDFEWCQPLEAEYGSVLDQFAVVFEQLDGAVTEGTGWAYNDIEAALQLNDISLNTRHLKSSIRWLALDLRDEEIVDNRIGPVDQGASYDPKSPVSEEEKADSDVDWLFSKLKSQDSPVLATIRLHLSSMSQSIGFAKHACTEQNQNSTRLLKVHIDDIAASVECIEAQLMPLEAFVETEKMMIDSHVKKGKGKAKKDVSAESSGTQEMDHAKTMPYMPAKSSKDDRTIHDGEAEESKTGSPQQLPKYTAVPSSTDEGLTQRNQWIWSPPHEMYYYPVQDGKGQWSYVWQNGHVQKSSHESGNNSEASERIARPPRHDSITSPRAFSDSKTL